MEYRNFIAAIVMLCATGASATAADVDLKSLKCSDVNALGADAKASVVAWAAFVKGELSARTKRTTVDIDSLDAAADTVISGCQLRPDRRFVDEFHAVDRQLSDQKEKSF
jgi:HdeA/HdeB family